MTTRILQRASILVLASVTLAACPDNGSHGQNDVASRMSVFPTPPVQTPKLTQMTISGTVSTLTGTPISGAIIQVNSSRVATTDGAGTFECTVTPAGNTYVTITVDKPGYLSGRRYLTIGTASAVANFVLRDLGQLSFDSPLTGTISSIDPPAYVGEDYDSEYVYHSKYYAFTTSATDDAYVEVSWTHAGNAALVLWIQGGLITSAPVGDRQRIQLPRNTSGNLIVGQPWQAGTLSQAVSFTLEMKRN